MFNEVLADEVQHFPEFDEEFINTKFINSLLKGIRNIFLLWLISRQKIHGYAIMSTMNEMISKKSGKCVHSSTIYPILHSLEEEGFIKSSQEFNGKHKVKLYEITDKGNNMLNSIKYIINNRPKDNLLRDFFDDMIFNDNMFKKTGGE